MKKIEKLEVDFTNPFTYKKWDIKKNQEYWFINSIGTVKNDMWGGYNADLSRMDIGNLFKTKEEAEIARDKIKELLHSL